MKNEITNNIEALFYLIKNHHEFMERGLSSTKKILDSIKSEKFDVLTQECENRQRLISVMEKIQKIIEDLILGNKSRLKNPVFKKEILKWQREYELWIIDIDNLDQYILNLLNQEKDKTTQEIATVFKNRQTMQRYDLSTTKNK